VDRPGGRAIFASQNRCTMKLKPMAEWRPRNLELIRGILEKAPGTLPVEFESINGAAFLSVRKCTDGRFETLSVKLRRGWLEDPAEIPELVLAVGRFARFASSFETNPFVRVPLVG
jgi:hypothetical protein